MNIEMQGAYKNFDDAARDILELVNIYLQDKTLFLSRIWNHSLTIKRVLNNDLSCTLIEGSSFEMRDTLWTLTVSSDRESLIIEDLRVDKYKDEFKEFIEDNIISYLGVPVIMKNGELYGTLCAVSSKPTSYSDEVVEVLKKVARLFSYFLEMQKLAERDRLTGLYNRHFLFNFFEEHPDNEGFLMFLDLDGFKKVNDEFGHEVGDLLLREVAVKLKDCLEEYDGFCVRLGGDEFIANIIGISDNFVAESLANEVLANLSNWTGVFEGIDVTTSIGMVFYPEFGSEITQLLKNADSALYNAKAEGKNQFMFFS